MVVVLIALLCVVPLAASADVTSISPPEARQQVLDGKLVLVDVRTPGEWRQTGLPDVAIGLDMTRKDFLQKLHELEASAGGVPIAYICSASGRSSVLSEYLDQSGAANVVNVTEGVLGNRDGPGWRKRGLPMRDAGSPPHPSIDPDLLPGR